MQQQSSDVSVKALLEAGVHFGHQVSRWDPRMKPYLFTARGGIHIIDLEKTYALLKKAANFVYDQVARGGTVLFVGTKPQAQEVIEQEAKRVNMFYVSQRWLGGMLTNYKTIKQSIDKLKNYYARVESGEITKLPKIEQLERSREAIKMERSLGGIRDMNQLPAVVVIVDPNREKIAKAEAARLRIPVVAIADSNCNPNGIDYLIPGNDDAIRAIQLIVGTLSEACEQGMNKRQEIIRKEVEAQGARKDAPDAAKAAAGGVEERKMAGNRGRAYTGKERGERAPGGPARPTVGTHGKGPSKSVTVGASSDVAPVAPDAPTTKTVQ